MKISLETKEKAFTLTRKKHFSDYESNFGPATPVKPKSLEIVQRKHPANWLLRYIAPQ